MFTLPVLTVMERGLQEQPSDPLAQQAKTDDEVSSRKDSVQESGTPPEV